MKMILTVYICSIITGICGIPTTQEYSYPKQFNTHYDCVYNGMKESFDILFESDISKSDVQQLKLYPRFTCLPDQTPGLDS